MSKYIWASPCIPLWYVIDNVEEWLEESLGYEWSTKEVLINTLEFVDSEGKKYPMSKTYRQDTLYGGALVKLFYDARKEGVEALAMCLDVHIMDAK